jgi:uncharacterized LabA/DUF88 family protein
MTDLQALATVDAKMKFLNKLLDGPELKAAFYKVMAVLAYNVSDKKKDRNVDECTPIIRERFPVPIYLIIDMLRRRFDNDVVNISKKVNWVWDFELLFYISPLEERILVTRDGDMIRAAERAGLKNTIWTLEEYKEMIKI